MGERKEGEKAEERKTRKAKATDEGRGGVKEREEPNPYSSKKNQASFRTWPLAGEDAERKNKG